ncbi:DUF6384 family protein [Pseudomonas sp. SDO528_S397]
MNNVLISEQLGAMALVDQLRHQQMEVDEHLSLPQRRVAVAARIREYYQSNNIAFTDAQIDQGVREFFARRLTFEAPPLSATDRLWTAVFIHRQKAVRLLQYVAIAALVVQCSKVVIEDNALKNAQKALAAEQTATAERHASLATQQARLATLQQQAAHHREPAAERLLARAQGWLAQAQPLLEQPSLSAPLLAQSDTALNDSAAIFEARAQLDQLQQDPAYLAGAPLFAALPAHWAEAASTLANADTQGLETTQRQITQLQGLLGNVSAVKPLAIEFGRLSAALAASHLPTADKQLLQTIAAQAKAAIEQFDHAGAQTQLDTLGYALDVAAKRLTLQIVDRSGVKSGVERCYKNSQCNDDAGATQGKSWYLVTQASDEAGNPARLPITSSETGQRVWASQFAVRVSRAEYLKVKADKLDDGHINERALGDKAADRLSMTFNGRVMHPVETILEW